MLVGAAALDFGDGSIAAEAEAERAKEKVQQEGAAPAGAWVQQLALLSACVRDIFGNPFRRSPPLPPSVLAWNDASIRRIAEGIYDERAFDRLPILADALEEAGCTNTDILNHLRGPGPHVRGCWVVDLLLGKE
jgi:hypothetical protein